MRGQSTEERRRIRQRLLRRNPSMTGRIDDFVGYSRPGGLALRFWAIPLAAMLVPLLGCSVTRVDSEHFGSSATIERAIERHYERNASEGNCFNPFIDGFTKLTVLEDAPDRLVVHARYLFGDRFKDGNDGGSGGGRCSGFGERTFALTRSAEGDLVVAMDGQQDEPVLRTLIRRVLPN
jgi:hypothetical protein